MSNFRLFIYCIIFILLVAFYGSLPLGFFSTNNACGFCGAVVFGQPRSSYLQKDFIDSLIDYAMFNFNLAMDPEGSDFQQRRAIREAKRVVAYLKSMAGKDINEKYILWKVSELQQQIMLEEKEIVLKEINRQYKSKEEIIKGFNKETAKTRPDFSVLKNLCDLMRKVDEDKAEQMQWLMSNRARNISREVLYSIESAIVQGNDNKAKEEIDYCESNRGFLQVPIEKYDGFKGKLTTRQRAVSLKLVLEKLIEEAYSSLKQNSIGKAWNSVNQIRNNMQTVGSELSFDERDAYESALAKLTSVIERKEDSLIMLTYDILNTQGVDAALRFMENVLVNHGVAPVKLGMVDNTIMEMVRLQQPAKENTGISRELASVETQSSSSNFLLEEIRQKAQQKARHKLDSIRAVAAERQRIQEEKDRIHRERELAIMRKIEQKRRKEEENAQKEVLKIYTLLEKNKVNKADKKLRKIRKSIEPYLSAEAITMLEKTIENSYQMLAEYHKAQDERARAVIKKEVDKKKMRTDVSQLSKSSAESGLVIQKVFDSYEQQQQKAQQDIIMIYSLLEHNRPQEAYRMFQEVRSNIQQLVCKEVFEMLESSVKRANVITPNIQPPQFVK